MLRSASENFVSLLSQYFEIQTAEKKYISPFNIAMLGLTLHLLVCCLALSVSMQSLWFQQRGPLVPLNPGLTTQTWVCAFVCACLCVRACVCVLVCACLCVHVSAVNFCGFHKSSTDWPLRSVAVVSLSAPPPYTNPSRLLLIPLAPPPQTPHERRKKKTHTHLH